MLALVLNTRRLISYLEFRLKPLLLHYTQFHGRGPLSITLALPEVASLQITRLANEGIYWARPEDQHQRFARGRALSIDAHGEDRFERLQAQFSTLCKVWKHLDPDQTGLKNLAFLGFSFNPNDTMQNHWQGFENACIQIPSLLLERKGSTNSLTFTCDMSTGKKTEEILYDWLSEALTLFQRATDHANTGRYEKTLNRVNDNPSVESWLQKVNAARAAIRKGEFDKVVLTRRVRIKSPKPLQPVRTLTWLAIQQSSGTQFAYSTPYTTLIGASPERLVTLQGEKVVCDAVAGTALRETNTKHDQNLGRLLLSDHKARHEQDLVVDFIRTTLEPMCVSLNAPVEPQLLKSATVQHLWSPIHGRVKKGISLLNLAATLHPTPAVGGTPVNQAMAWLEDQEKGHRGWYTGALGWIAPDGSGELAVILRCALLNNSTADLFVGAGIVKESDSEAELAETEWKLRTMYDALTEA